MVQVQNGAIELTGPTYGSVLRALHDLLEPANYLEVGTRKGGSLRHATCPSIAIDPRFELEFDAIGDRPEMHFYQQTSDDYFASRDPTAVLGQPVDLAFLDGMHLFEFLLRDFMNTERHCRTDSVILLHDCLPGDPYMATRSSSDPRRAQSVNRKWWPGDVWKVPVILRRLRPDLRIHTLDARSTGLVLITGLDPENRTLESAYDALMAEFLDLELEAYGLGRLIAETDIVSAKSAIEPAWLAQNVRPLPARPPEVAPGSADASSSAAPERGRPPRGIERRSDADLPARPRRAGPGGDGESV